MKKATYSEAGMATTAAHDAINAPVGYLTVTKVVKDHVPLHATEGGSTFGRFIDAHLEEIAMAGECVQSFTLEIDEDYWRNFSQMVNRVPQAD